MTSKVCTEGLHRGFAHQRLDVVHADGANLARDQVGQCSAACSCGHPSSKALNPGKCVLAPAPTEAARGGRPGGCRWWWNPYDCCCCGGAGGGSRRPGRPGCCSCRCEAAAGYGAAQYGRSLLVKAARAAELPAASDGGTCGHRH